MYKFIKISDCGELATYDQVVCLSIDIDWVTDDVLEDTIDLIESYGVPATWFATHDTPLLARLRRNEKFELGIHPNFNNFLHANETRTLQQAIDSLIHIVPEAISVRSHSLVQSSRLIETFSKAGLRFECNHFIPYQSGIALRPWSLWNGIIKVPFVWEDDVHCLFKSSDKISDVLKSPGLKVFSFHPIHVFLNTEDLSRYEKTRAIHHDSTTLLSHRHDGYGARSQLIELLSYART